MRVTITAASPLRYTPTGVPVYEATLHHAGEAFEAGSLRKVEFETPAIALGDVAVRLNALTIPQTIDVTGFLAPKSLRSRKLIVHITDYII